MGIEKEVSAWERTTMGMFNSIYADILSNKERI